MKPWRAADGGLGGALLFFETITAEVEARHALAESEERFRATFENAAVGIVHLDPNLRYLRANNALSGIVGWPLDEFVTESVDDVTTRTIWPTISVTSNRCSRERSTAMTLRSAT
jgi:PAS domain S-box-containing protein